MSDLIGYVVGDTRFNRKVLVFPYSDSDFVFGSLPPLSVVVRSSPCVDDPDYCHMIVDIPELPKEAECGRTEDPGVLFDGG